MVHLLQLLLGNLQGVGRGIDLIGLKALIGKLDSERLVILLWKAHSALASPYQRLFRRAQQTCGTFSACDEAASVVTERRARGVKA